MASAHKMAAQNMAAATLALLVVTVHQTTGACTFPESWAGGWFQSGLPGLLAVNTTHIQSKGQCHETEAHDKFLLYDKSDDCYRCMVIHEKHASVLQYKETSGCLAKDSLPNICDSISGDAPLYSMFRKVPPPTPVSCPFRPAPFTFTYSRGSGDCTNPPSKAESCTDDSRLLLRYQACPDVPSTESNVEELVCLATWKEGSTRYLVGTISQMLRRNSIVSDEDIYRCFVYKGSHWNGRTTYNIAQSGDATCSALTSPTDGSRTIALTTSDDHHRRCHFPAWITEHHKWHSLDQSHQYQFTQRNATLRITRENGSVEEMRLVCHSILKQQDREMVQLVAHATQGCVSGAACMVLHRRDAGVMEVQLGPLGDLAEQACNHLPPVPYLTLTSVSLQPTRCPNPGRYAVASLRSDRRKRRQPNTHEHPGDRLSECAKNAYRSVQVGCSSHDTIEFNSECSSDVYTCHGSWTEDNLGLILASPQARDSNYPGVYCFMYIRNSLNGSRGAAEQLRLSAVGRSCDRSVLPGLTGDKAYNLTLNGTCVQSSHYNSESTNRSGSMLLSAAALCLALSSYVRTR